MAGLAALPMLGKALLVAQAVGTIAQGMQAKQSGRAVARQMESQANLAEAQGQRAYLDEQRKGRYIESALLASAGASGAGVSDVTVENLRDDILDQSLYNAMNALYKGESRARELRWEGAVKRDEGRQAMKAALFKTVGDLGTSAFSNGWFDPKQSATAFEFKDIGDVPSIDMAPAFKPKLKKSKYNPLGISI